MSYLLRISLLLTVIIGCGRAAYAVDDLVYEVEDWSEPKAAWQSNVDSPSHWNLWTKEKDVNTKRSRGASLKTPVVTQDRMSPEEGAPPLHTRITGIPSGSYQVWMAGPGRNLAWSIDNEQWQTAQGQSDVLLGVYTIDDGVFELWVDDRYATLPNVGSSYYDTIRLTKYTPPTLSHFQVYDTEDGRLQISWISSEPMDTGVLEQQVGDDYVVLATSSERMLRNHRVWVDRSAVKDKTRVRVTGDIGPRYTFVSPTVTVTRPSMSVDRQPKPQTIPLALAAKPVAGRAIIAGVPIAQGMLTDPLDTSVKCNGKEILSQTTVTARWLDGSVKWLLTRFMSTGQASGYALEIATKQAESDNPFTCNQDAQGITIDNTKLRVSFKRKSFSIFSQVTSHDKTVYVDSPIAGGVCVTDAEGVAWQLADPDQMEIEERGPVRAVVRVEGPLQSRDGNKRYRYRLRYFIAADSPLIRVQITLTNNANDRGFDKLASYCVRIPVAGEGEVIAELPHVEQQKLSNEQSIALRQVDDKRVRVGVDDDGAVVDDRCMGWAVAQRGAARIAVAMRDFWQHWPKGLAINADAIELRLLPVLRLDEAHDETLWNWAQHGYWFDAGRYRFKRSMAYRSEFWVRFDGSDEPIPNGDWQAWSKSLHTLPYASPSATYHCKTGVWGKISPAVKGQHAAYEQMVERNHQRVLELRETRAAYGWMNFGDWHGERGINWGNNEYDLAWSMASQFARSGRWDYFRTGQQMAEHYATIDTVHISWQEQMKGLVYAHTIGHVGAEGMPPEKVRNEQWDQWYKSSRYFLHGPIDVGGHIFEEGNVAYYFLTGDRDLKDVAELVVDAQATYLTPRFDFHIERAAGWPLINAVAAYEAGGNPFYLNAARIYIERILEKQNPDGGNWLLPQDPSECNHPRPHYGSKSFATGVLLYGMMRYDLVEPRDDVKQSIIDACDWFVDKAWNEEKRGFRYKTGCDVYKDNADTGTAQAICVSGLAYGWSLTKDPRFSRVLHICIENIVGQTGGIGKQATQLIRQSAYALPALDTVP